MKPWGNAQRVSSDPSAGAYGRRAEALAPGLRSLKGCFGGVGKEDPLPAFGAYGLLRWSRLGEVSPKTHKGDTAAWPLQPNCFGEVGGSRGDPPNDTAGNS